MIYVLGSFFFAAVIVTIALVWLFGMHLIVEGLSDKSLRQFLAGFLILVAILTIVFSAIIAINHEPNRCGVGTEYVPETNGHDWYCKTDKDY